MTTIVSNNMLNMNECACIWIPLYFVPMRPIKRTIMAFLISPMTVGTLHLSRNFALEAGPFHRLLPLLRHVVPLDDEIVTLQWPSSRKRHCPFWHQQAIEIHRYQWLIRRVRCHAPVFVTQEIAWRRANLAYYNMTVWIVVGNDTSFFFHSSELN